MRNKSHIPRNGGVTVALAVTCALFAAGMAAPAGAHRPPISFEQQALTGAVVRQQFQHSMMPLACLDLRFLVSTVNERYAIVTSYLSRVHACDRWRFNGAAVLFFDIGGWRVIYVGSDPPRCSQIPPAVTLDLFGIPCLRI